MIIVDGIELDGLSHPESVSALHASRCSHLPDSPGVYVVLRRSGFSPRFLPVSGAGWFKSMDPSYPLPKVEAAWVPRATVVYVGMTESKKGLRGRVRALVDFAHGRRVGHRGGRMLWHLKDWESLEVACRSCRTGSAYRNEMELIESFRQTHGVRPFANKTK